MFCSLLQNYLSLYGDQPNEQQQLASLAALAPFRYFQHQQTLQANLLSSLLQQSPSPTFSSPSNEKQQLYWPRQTSPPLDTISLERAARFHKNAAALCDATCTWSGTLPARSNKSGGTYSCKVSINSVIFLYRNVWK